MKLKNIVAVVGKWTDKNGQQKFNYKTVGELHSGENGQFILMDKSFNLCAVVGKDPNDHRVLLSLYDPQPTATPVTHDQPTVTAQSYRNAKNNPPADTGFDDEIPF